MDNNNKNHLLDRAIEQIKSRQVDDEPLGALKEEALEYVTAHKGRKMHFTHYLGQALRYAAIVLMCVGVLWYVQLWAGDSTSNLAWGDVVKRVATIDCVHLYQYDYVNGALVSSRQGWGWYGGGKICFVDDKGVITVDDGDSKAYYNPAGELMKRKESEFGNIDECISGGNFIFDMLVKGVFGYNDQQVSQVRPSEVGQDFLVYKFDAPTQPVGYIKGVSVLVGRGSGLPVQVRVEGNIGTEAYAMVVFDYQSDKMPQNVRDIMGYNENLERIDTDEK